MQGFQKIFFIALICFFGSASIFVGGTDLLRRLNKHTAQETEAVKKLIENLRGEVISNDEKVLLHPHVIPARKGGGYLSENDKSRIKRFFGGLAGGQPQEAAPAQEIDETTHVPSESVNQAKED